MIRTIVILCFLWLLFGCATIPECPTCPTEDIYINITTPSGPSILQLKKGALNDPEVYKTQEQYDKWLKELEEKARQLNRKNTI